MKKIILLCLILIGAALLWIPRGPALPPGLTFAQITNPSSSGSLPTGLSFALPTLTISTAGSGNGAWALSGNTSGTATCTAPAIAGTSTNGVTCSNIFLLPSGTSSAPAYSFSAQAGTGFDFTNGVNGGNGIGVTVNGGGHFVAFGASYIMFHPATPGIVFGSTDVNGTADTNMSRKGPGLMAFGNALTQGSTAGFIKTAQTVSLSADWTCGTGGTVSSCVAATIVGSTATPLTFTLPLVAANWSFECDLVVGQATAATANQWNILTATNGVTNTTASYQMATAATAFAAGAVTDQASTTTTFQITPSWTLGGTATKMPVHIAGTLTGVSASGTVASLQLVAPTVGDLVTIYEGSKCSLNP